VSALNWAAILVLGPGALLVFGWFLRDLRGLLGRDEDGPSRPGESQ